MEGKKKVVIVGGGFGGVTTALELYNKLGEKIDITLVSDQPHFEYHAALYRAITGKSPLEVCIPLSEIFSDTSVNVVEDKIIDIDPKTKVAVGSSGSKYAFNKLVFAIGSQTAFYDIPGLKEHSFTVKTIHDALKIKRHFHQLFESGVKSQKRLPIHIVVAGGGPTGVEVAGELAVYLKKLSLKHNLPKNAFSIDLFEAGKSLLPSFTVWAQNTALMRLKKLGVNVNLNTPILKEDVENIYLPEMQLKTKTVIWTAGVTANATVKNIKPLKTDERGRIIVNNQLLMDGSDSIYVIGDAANSSDSGTAQAAISQGKYVAHHIAANSNGKRVSPYTQIEPKYAVPIGPGWAIYQSGHFRTAGQVGWALRRLIDLKFFNGILPAGATWRAFRDGQTIFETCIKCSTLSNEQ